MVAAIFGVTYTVSFEWAFIMGKEITMEKEMLYCFYWELQKHKGESVFFNLSKYEGLIIEWSLNWTFRGPLVGIE